MTQWRDPTDTPEHGIQETYVCLVIKKENGITSVKPEYVTWYFNRWTFAAGHEEGWKVLSWLDENTEQEKRKISLSFATWLGRNRYEPLSGELWYGIGPDGHINFSIGQLYEIYLTEINTQHNKRNLS